MTRSQHLLELNLDLATPHRSTGARQPAEAGGTRSTAAGAWAAIRIPSAVSATVRECARKHGVQ